MHYQEKPKYFSCGNICSYGFAYRTLPISLICHSIPTSSILSEESFFLQDVLEFPSSTPWNPVLPAFFLDILFCCQTTNWDRLLDNFGCESVYANSIIVRSVHFQVSIMSLKVAHAMRTINHQPSPLPRYTLYYPQSLYPKNRNTYILCL